MMDEDYNDQSIFEKKIYLINVFFFLETAPIQCYDGNFLMYFNPLYNVGLQKGDGVGKKLPV